MRRYHKLNLPTAVPYVFEFDENLNVSNDYFLGNAEEIKKMMEAVANQGRKAGFRNKVLYIKKNKVMSKVIDLLGDKDRILSGSHL